MTTKQSELFVGDLAAHDARTGKPVRSGLNPGLLLGFFVVAVLPAVFWTLVVFGVAWLMGTQASGLVLISVFAVIAAFLGIIFSAIARKSDRR